MDQSQITPPEPRAQELIEQQSRPSEEVIQELVDELERLLESGLHPMDQGEILEELPRKFRPSLLAELDALVLSDILESMEPEESAAWIGDRLSAELAEVLNFTDTDVAVDLL